ncbi:alpha-glucuronidase [Pararcticibacter amylolyticus]|uniref:Alpha-glucuronidase n=1 Tax=Pararcticibacter amylolyticus TaxID=2173175 RepID=A0A2U2PIX7_9SPHI|nr:alpha-glucuronidase [Pararcticibacter amylolyticus]PWG81341.1 alpha-glucuronidase [Pararcticibacter amylolyticus]
MNIKTISGIFCIILCMTTAARAENGHQLWLRKGKANPVTIVCQGSSPILKNAVKELEAGWLGEPGSKLILSVGRDKRLKGDGFMLDSRGIHASTDKGILYGVYDLLRRQKTGESAKSVVSNPAYEYRLLNHWDNLDGSVERGYAGRSIFWRGDKDLAVTQNDRVLWQEYARACASVGINASVLNNVNASPRILDPEYLKRVKAIADILRPYGIKTFLSVNFSSPVRLGGLKTSDPLDKDVIRWWKVKTEEIYKLIPDFGGFLVKANSEGQPGPQDFGRTHADGANMMADVLKPYRGIVMWRAFVYSSQEKDRARQAYNEFMPLDGAFRDNVIIQVKNGPIDFQPREPFSPLFGAMKKTAVMPELQITQEYLGHSYQLAFLAPMWEECLKSDTYQEGKGSTVARCTDGSIFKYPYTAIAGVANTGLDLNWCGHPFAQANWYAFGRQAWDHTLTSEQIADEWTKLTFYNPDVAYGKSEKHGDWERGFLKPVKEMMLESREAVVNYSMPLGFHHIFSADDHYGPGPWFGPKSVRPDWTSVYYHQADTNGVGFNRTRSGSNAVSQYHEPLASQLNDVQTCPEKYLLWFHHLPWDFKLKSGKTLWDEICFHYDHGIQQVRGFQKTWDLTEPYVDKQRFLQVQNLLMRQTLDAQVWKDGCILYFQQFSRRPVPYDLERPVFGLEFIKKKRPILIFE